MELSTAARRPVPAPAIVRCPDCGAECTRESPERGWPYWRCTGAECGLCTCAVRSCGGHFGARCDGVCPHCDSDERDEPLVEFGAGSWRW